MASEQKIHLRLLFLIVFLWTCEAQRTPSIGFISPDVVTDIGSVIYKKLNINIEILTKHPNTILHTDIDD